MAEKNYLIYGLIALFLVMTVLSIVFPVLLAGIFLCATLAVAAVTMMAGFRAGAGFYIIAAIIILLLPLRDILGFSEFFFRFFGFTLASSFLSVLSYRLRVSERNRNDEISLMSAIVESSDDAIIGKTLDGVITSWNEGAYGVFGYTAEEAIGQPVTMLFPEDRYPEEVYILNKIKSGEKVAHYETIRKRKNGQLFPVSITISPIKDSSGKIIGASKIARDITDRKEYEDSLAKAQERYKTFIENSEEAIWMVEYKTPVDTALPIEEQIDLLVTSGIVGECNLKMAQLYGFKKVSDVLGKHVTSFAPPTEGGREVLRMWIANNYSISNYESKAVDGEGHTRYGSTSFKGIIEEGKVVRGWAVQRETTEQKLQQQEIIKSEERYKTFIENSDEGICRIEFKNPISTSIPLIQQTEKFFTEGYIAEANDVTARIMGLKNSTQLLNIPLKEVEGKSDADELFIKNFVQNGYSINNYPSTEKRGDRSVYHSSSMKGIIENGFWVRAWLTRIDVTAQKEAEVEKERLLEESEKAKRDLEVASAEKDKFLANLSHELRTPLVSVLGYSSMLLETDPNSAQAKKMVTTINKNAKLQLQLIEDLLDLSRIISGKIELKKDYFKVNELATDAIDTFRKQAEDKGLKLTEHYEECSFYGDKKRLSQVFLNLLSNAVKFTDKGEVQVFVRCSSDYLTIKIKDTGIGIDPKDFGLLFQPFKQLDASSTRSKQGLGLGLSIVKNIVDLHKGKVEVQSKLKEGSEFTVYLPVIQAPEVVEGQKSVEVEKSITFNGVTMLLVEDDPDSAGFIKYLYEQKGAAVDWVESAKAARKAIEGKKYKLYIFDLSMPEEDGISLIKSIRAKGDITKAVALTAFADNYYEKTALDSGFDMFLKKPSSLMDLLSVIKLLK